MPDSSIKFSSRGAFSYNWNKCIDNERAFFFRLAKSMAGFFIGLFCGYTVTKTEVVILIKHGDYKDSIFYKEYSTELECRKAKKVNGISIINNEKKKESVNNKETNKQEPLKINIDETIKTKVVSVKISLLDHLKELINSENFDLSDEAFSTANLQSLDAADALLLFNSALANNGFKCNKIALRLLKETECKQLFGNLTGTEKEKALLFIASIGCAISLEKLLSHDRKGINCQNSFACTPLLITVIENNVECLRVLLKYNTAVNMSNSCGLKPIHCAVDEECLTLLLNAGADVNSTDAGSTTKTTPLYYAIKNGNIGCFNVLLNREGVDVNNLNNDFDETPLECAVRLGLNECVSALLKMPGIVLNRPRKDGKTLISEALISGNVECLKLLLEDGRINVDCIKSLFYAIKFGINLQSLKVILNDTSVNLKEKDPDGNTLLHTHIAMSNVNSDKSAAYSRAHRGDEGEHYRTIAHNHVQILNELVRNDVIRAQINDKNNAGDTALHVAASACNIDSTTALLAVPSIDINVKDSSNRTPLARLNQYSYSYNECDDWFQLMIENIVKQPVTPSAANK